MPCQRAGSEPVRKHGS